MAVAGLGECRSCRGGSFGLGDFGDCGLGYCRCCLGCRGCGFQRGICRGPRGGLSGSGVSIGGRLVRAIARYLAPVGLPRRRRGRIGLNPHMRDHAPAGINHATSTKGPASRRHKPRRHKRSARARNTAVGTGRIKPRGVDGKPTAGRTIAKARILQIHAVGAHVRSGPSARGNDAPAAAHDHVASDHAGDSFVGNIGPVCPGIDGAAVHHERLRNVDPALRARRLQGPGAAKRQVAPHLHAAQRDVRIGRMRLRHGVLPDKRQHQVAVGADGLARVAVKLQVVGIGPGPAGARHARLVVRRTRDDEALRARGIRRPAQQNA